MMAPAFGGKMIFEPQEIFDISPIISADLAVWPGDKKFERQVVMSMKEGANLELSTISTTVHLGAHADAPNHYHVNGSGIHGRPLHYYLGTCQVIDININRGERIQLQDINNKKIQCPRLLFKTESFPNPNEWNSDFNSFSPELINYLAQQKVKLIGIDTPSIDPENDKDLLAHAAVYKNNMAILEGIVLSKVPEGLYTLIALPLPLKDADASPVRAILVKGAIS